MEMFEISQQQAKELAKAFANDIEAFVESHKAEFEIYLKNETEEKENENNNVYVVRTA